MIIDSWYLFWISKWIVARFKKELHALVACIPCPQVVTIDAWSEDPAQGGRRVLLMEPILHRYYQKPVNLYERYTMRDRKLYFWKHECLENFVCTQCQMFCKSLNYSKKCFPYGARFWREVQACRPFLRGQGPPVHVFFALAFVFHISITATKFMQWLIFVS